MTKENVFTVKYDIVFFYNLWQKQYKKYYTFISLKKNITVN